MASNGRVGMRSGSPSFLVVGLSLVIIVLLYSYWSVSSRNSMLLRDQSFLQDRLRSLTSQKLAAEKKKSSAMTQIANMEKTKRQLEGNVRSSSKEKSDLNSKIQTLEQNLEEEKKKAATFQSQQSKSKVELQKLKGEIDQTSEKLKELTKKANSFVEMYKGVKETLAKKNDELWKVQNDWNICKVKLKNHKEEHPAPGVNADDKKKTDLMKGKGNTVFKQGIARLKKQMELTSTKPAFESTVKTGSDTEKTKALVSPVANNATLQTKPTGKVAITSGNQSGNDTNKVASSNNATSQTKPTGKVAIPSGNQSGNDTNKVVGTKTATSSSAISTGSTNTTTTNLNKQVENKNNTTKPTKHSAEVESDVDSPEDKQNKPDGTESESENTQNQDEDDNDNIPVGPRAQPIGLKFPRRTGSDRGRTRLS